MNARQFIFGFSFIMVLVFNVPQVHADTVTYGNGTVKDEQNLSPLQLFACDSVGFIDSSGVPHNGVGNSSIQNCVTMNDYPYIVNGVNEGVYSPDGSGGTPPVANSSANWLPAFTGLSPDITVTYNATIFDETTQSFVSNTGSVAPNDVLLISSTPHQSADISWVATGYAADSPNGDWVPGATAPLWGTQTYTTVDSGSYQAYGPFTLLKDFAGYSQNYGTSGVVTYKVYIPFEVNPPQGKTISTSGLNCPSSQSVSSDGLDTVSETCTVLPGSSSITATITYPSTYGYFYYRLYSNGLYISAANKDCAPNAGPSSPCHFDTDDPAGPIGNDDPLRVGIGNKESNQYATYGSLGSSGYKVIIPQRSISYSIPVSTDTPNPPQITCPTTSVLAGQDITIYLTASDPDNEQVQYAVDWDQHGSEDSDWSSLVTSGTQGYRTKSGGFSTPGTYPITGYTRNSDGNISIPSTSSTCNVTVVSEPNLTASTNDLTGTTNTQLAIPGTVTNIGAVSTGADFTNLLEIENGPLDGNGNPTGSFLETPVTIDEGGALAGNTSKQVPSQYYTFPTAGTYYYRYCADKSSAGDQKGVITESNETDNCSYDSTDKRWSSITINPPITASCTVTSSPSSGVAPVTATWTVTNTSGGDGGPYTYTWTGNGVTGGTGTPLNETYSSAGTYNGSVDVSDGIAADDSGVIPCSPASVAVTNPTITAPTNLHAYCSADGTSINLSWDPTPNATQYDIRLNDTNNDSSSCQYGWDCSSPPDYIATLDSTYTTETYPVTPGDHYDWWIDAGGAATHYYDGNGNLGFSCQLPNLKATTNGAVTGTTNSTLTLSGAIHNYGSASTGSTFKNLLEVEDATTGVIVDHVIVPEPNGAALAAQASQAVTATTNYTFPNTDSYEYQYCANSQFVNGGASAPDPASTFTESYTNDNCSGWSPITITQASGPSAPSTSAPVCNADGTVSFSWGSSPGAAYYTPNIYQSPSTCTTVSGWLNFLNPDSTQTCYYPQYSQTSISSFPVTSGQNYSFWVTATNSSGTKGADSAHYNFTCQAPALPNLKATTNGAVTGTTNSTLTLSGAIHNYGSASTGSTFKNLLEVEDATTGVIVDHVIVPEPNGAALAAQASQAVTATTNYTFPNTDSYEYQYCANSQFVNGGASAPDPASTFTESYTNDNCSGWSPITITQASGPSAPSTSAPVCNADGTVSFSWGSSPGAAYYTPNIYQSPSTCTTVSGWLNFLNPDSTQTCYYPQYSQTSISSFPVTSGQNYSFWVTATNSSGTKGADSAHYNFTCQAPALPNLKATTNGAVTGTTNSTLTLSGAIHNYGSASTGSTFKNLLEVEDATTGVIVDHVIVPEPNGAALAAQASQAVTATTNYTFPNTDSYEYQYCANSQFVNGGASAPDPASTFTESYTNDNCSGWSAITISAPAIPSLSATDITSQTIPYGQQFNLSSTIKNATGYAAAGPFPELFQVATDANGTGAKDLTTYSTNPGLTAGAQSNFTYTYTPSTAGIYYIRACADISTTGAPVGVPPSIAVSDPNNLCAPDWVPVIVTPGAPTNVSVQCTDNTHIAISWTAPVGAGPTTGYTPNVGMPSASQTFATTQACTTYGNGLWAIWGTAICYIHNYANTSVTNFPVVAGQQYNVWVTAANPGEVGGDFPANPIQIPVTCGVSPDLTAGDAPAVNVNAGQPNPLSGTIIDKNYVPFPQTGFLFWNNFQVCAPPDAQSSPNPDCHLWQDIDGNATSNISAPITGIPLDGPLPLPNTNSYTAPISFTYTPPALQPYNVVAYNSADISRRIKKPSIATLLAYVKGLTGYLTSPRTAKADDNSYPLSYRWCADMNSAGTVIIPVLNTQTLCGAWGTMTVVPQTVNGPNNPNNPYITCAPTKSVANVGDTITWTATPYNFTIYPSFSWTDGHGSATSGTTGSTYTNTYTSAGNYGVQVQAVLSGQTLTAECTPVTINGPSVTLTASPTRVQANQGAADPITLTWTSSDLDSTYANNCRLSETPVNGLGTVPALGTSGSQTDSHGISSQTTYTITCSSNAKNPEPTVSSKAIVNVVPTFTNF